MPVIRRCLCCVKYLMFVFNLIFWVSMYSQSYIILLFCLLFCGQDNSVLYVGFLLFQNNALWLMLHFNWYNITFPEKLGGCGWFGVGIWLSFKQTEFSSLPSFPSLSAANLLLVAGGIIMVTGFLGCLGALKEQRCLLFTVRGSQQNQWSLYGSRTGNGNEWPVIRGG